VTLAATAQPGAKVAKIQQKNIGVALIRRFLRFQLHLYQ
jgi:hypothetical protein